MRLIDGGYVVRIDAEGELEQWLLKQKGEVDLPEDFPNKRFLQEHVNYLNALPVGYPYLVIPEFEEKECNVVHLTFVTSDMLA